MAPTSLDKRSRDNVFKCGDVFLSRRVFSENSSEISSNLATEISLAANVPAMGSPKYGTPSMRSDRAGEQTAKPRIASTYPCRFPSSARSATGR